MSYHINNHKSVNHSLLLSYHLHRSFIRSFNSLTHLDYSNYRREKETESENAKEVILPSYTSIEEASLASMYIINQRRRGACVSIQHTFPKERYIQLSIYLPTYLYHSSFLPSSLPRSGGKRKESEGEKEQ